VVNIEKEKAKKNNNKHMSSKCARCRAIDGISFTNSSGKLTFYNLVPYRTISYSSLQKRYLEVPGYDTLADQSVFFSGVRTWVF
jgi:hypothetical protein